MSDFQTNTKESVTTIKCPLTLDEKAAAAFTSLTAPWMEKPNQVYVLDLTETDIIDRHMYRPIMLFHQHLKQKKCFLFSIGVKHEILSQLKENGLESIFSPKKSLAEAMDSAGIKTNKPKIDIEFINPFIKATLTTIETQANIQVTPGKPHVKKDTDPNTTDIAGIISLTSQAFHGSIALCFPQKVFLSIYSQMVDEVHTELNKEIEDAAGELLNIIFGQAKAHLNDKAGYQIQKAIPTVVRGSNLGVHHLTRSIAIVLPFETAAGTFSIEISTDRI